MRHFWIVLMAVAVAMVMALPATAQKGGIPGPPDKGGIPGPPDNEPPVSVTCVSPWWEGPFVTDDFDIYITREAPDACIDVLSQFSGKWIVDVEVVDGSWRRPELMMVPRDAAWVSDSCGGEKRYGADVFEQWTLPPTDDARGFTEVPAATVNACPGNDPDGVGEFAELVERLDEEPEIEIVFDKTEEVHPLAFVVWSHNLRKGDKIKIHVNLPDESTVP